MIYAFADCELDIERHRLTRDGEEVHVEPQVFRLLACLVAAGGKLVRYEQVIAEIWDGRIVSDATVAARLSMARRAVGDDGKRQEIIRTIQGHGLQLAVPVNPSNQLGTRTTNANGKRQTIRYTTSRDGTGIAWAESGEGSPILRGGHWLGHLDHDWSSPVWRPLLDRLSTGRRLIRYDPRGTGLSERHMNGATVEALADDMEAVADAAGLETFPVYATSQSVPAALVLAARHPERVSHLILLNGMAQGSSARGEPEQTETIVGMIRAGWGVPGSPFMRAVATVFMPRSTPEEIESLVEMQSLSTTPELAAEIRRVISELDVTEHLEKIECPTLLMHCADDQVQSPEQSKLMARLIANAEFQMLDSPNHIVVPSDPDWEESMSALERFLAKHS